MENMFPNLKKEFILRIGPVSYVYALTEQKHFMLNQDAAEIVFKCDGQNNIKKISQELALSHQEEFESTLETVQEYLSSQEFIHLSKKQQNLGERIFGSWNIQTPAHVSIELTYECNFRCKHCYNESGAEFTSYIDKEQIFGFLDDLKDNGVIIVELTGGEPLMHPDFMSIVEYCLNLFSIVGIITNGYLLDEKILDTLSPYKDKLAFQVGLHGINEEYMDWFCGQEGAFEHAKKAIKLLVKNDFILRVNFVVTPINVEQMYETVLLAKSLGGTYTRGMYTIGINNVLPMGRGDSPELLFSPTNISIFIKELELVLKEFKDFIFEIPEVVSASAKKACGAGSRSLSITPNGDVKLCVMSDEKLLSWGNVYDEKLENIFQNNNCLEFMDVEAPKPKICGDCEHIMFCGYCIARGIQKFHENKENCIWGQKIKLNEILNGDTNNV